MILCQKKCSSHIFLFKCFKSFKTCHITVPTLTGNWAGKTSKMATLLVIILSASSSTLAIMLFSSYFDTACQDNNTKMDSGMLNFYLFLQ